MNRDFLNKKLVSKHRLATILANDLKIDISSRLTNIFKLTKYRYPTPYLKRRIVNQPMILISQIQRSGGTLLNRLFDGHSQILSHPWELIFLKNRQIDFQLQALSKQQLFNFFFSQLQSHEISFMRHGYKELSSDDAENFVIDMNQRTNIFFELLDSMSQFEDRDYLNLYFSAYFSSLLAPYSHWEPKQKKFICAFAPRFIEHPPNPNWFFNAYPDGFLITIMRDPVNWLASANKHSYKYENSNAALQMWLRNARGVLNARERAPKQIFVLRFEDLIMDTESVMRSLSSLIGIHYQESMQHPTFGSNPIRSNSSHSKAYGIQKEVLNTSIKFGSETEKLLGECNQIMTHLENKDLFIK